MKSPLKHEVELLTRVLNQLQEHFDSVQIFVTRHEPAEHNGTIVADMGVGNWYARFGQIKEWMNREEEIARQHARMRCMENYRAGAQQGQEDEEDEE